MLGSLKSLGKRAFYRALHAVAVDSLLARRLGGRLVVLNLHRVSPDANPYWSPLHPAHFDELLAFVTRHFCVTTFAGAATAPRDRPSLILSFDDGYYDFVEHAMPLLHRYRIVANQNIIGECVRSGRPVWNVELADFLNRAPRSLMSEIRLAGFAAALPTSDADLDGKVRFGLAISAFVKQRPRAEQVSLRAYFETLQTRCDYAPTRMMTATDIQAAARDHEIGSHSYSHASMGYETDEFFLRDLQESRAFHAELGLPCSIYAFPNGSYRPAQIDALRANGIETVLLVDEKVAKRGSDVVPRITYYASTASEACVQAVAWRAQLNELRRA